VAVERVFSGGRDTVSVRRASLGPATIRNLMILKASIRHGSSTESPAPWVQNSEGTALDTGHRQSDTVIN
jgi:hypothetical protein